MEFNYKDYFTKEDLAKRGYNLEADGVLETSHFRTIEDAIDDFMNDAFDTIFHLIEDYRGEQWASDYFTDMAKTDLPPVAIKWQQALKKALIEQAIFIYDNGNPNATFNDGRSQYAPKAIEQLWHNALNLGRG